jgi:hypothetical protein
MLGGCKLVAMQLQETTAENFQTTVMSQNVNPIVRAETLKGRYFTSDWLLNDRRVIGVSVADSWGIDPRKYFLPATLTAPKL